MCAESIQQLSLMKVWLRRRLLPSSWQNGQGRSCDLMMRLCLVSDPQEFLHAAAYML